MVNAWRKQHIRDQRSPKRQDPGGKTGHNRPLKRVEPPARLPVAAAPKAFGAAILQYTHATRVPLQYGSFATANLRNLCLETSSPVLLVSSTTQKRTSSRRNLRELDSIFDVYR